MIEALPRRTILGRQPKPMTTALSAPWDELCARIRSGMVIPIVSNNLHDDRILRPLINRYWAAQQEAPLGSTVSIDEQLAQDWATNLGYPLHGAATLAQVAQYCRVNSADDVAAQRSYLTFLKTMVLDLSAGTAPDLMEIVRDLRRQQAERSFSAMTGDLGLPDALPADTDPLRLLARLNLPIYVTTSYYDFLERAIVAEGRKPYTQICGEISNLSPSHRFDRDFEPSAERPVVYHLHGLEEYPGSLVLSEDDYLRFVIRVTQPVDPEKQVIPLYLSEKLAESTLLLLGYRLQDWDFRTTYRGLINVRDEPRRTFSMTIQLDPNGQANVGNPTAVQRYLEEYFRPVNFRVHWSNTDDFVRTLWHEYYRRQQREQ